MRVGIIGAGNIGATLAGLLTRSGYEVAVANSRGPDSLREVEAATGARATRVEDVGANVDALIISVPQKAVPLLPAATFSRAPVVIDTNNYYPWRDGRIEALDEGEPDSVWVQRHVGRPVAKAFNSIQSNSLARLGRPAGAPDRIALPVSGDDATGTDIASALVDEAGFSAVQAGTLAESWRQQPGAPVYCTDQSAAEVRRLLPLADRARLPELRDAAIREFMAATPAPTPEQRREIFRRLYLPH
ncbi:MAG: NAD(P)-binding domain-containing protein [Hyphomonadaceae bacterium]|nr:NAD(P)-binding domain-containing protein [Hyphomonadaceae bacterium]